ncbi:hypothetical protein FRC19_009686 [Serendipita sp. 401]|nr:hypothetical protein FRC19_009686 [Serendipita sp. 401]KAG9052255.1 hypothetical protein FS842_010238 [Serendipita sp. 407]
MGRDVVLQIPVSPVSVHSGLVEGKVEGERLLHTLAAKALVQVFEDLPKTPENKAEIERLGKRYSLATSATSFVAIDEDTKDEIEKKESQAFEPEEERFKDGSREQLRMQSARYSSLPTPQAASAIVTGFNPGSITTGYSRSAVTTGFNPSAITTGFNPNSHGYGRAAAVPAPSPSSIYAAQPISLGSASLSSADEDLEVDALSVSPEIVKMQSDASTAAQAPKKKSKMSFGGLFSSRKSAAPTASFSAPPPPPPAPMVSMAPPPAAPGGAAPQYQMHAAPMRYADTRSDSNYAPAASSSQQTLSVESIARAQKFDGSFPSDDNHLRFVLGADGLSKARELPPALKQLAGGGSNAQDATKKLIWATVLTIICLQKKFGAEKDSWEMLADKAREYIEKELIDLGLEESNVTTTVNELETAASALF